MNNKINSTHCLPAVKSREALQLTFSHDSSTKAWESVRWHFATDAIEAKNNKKICKVRVWPRSLQYETSTLAKRAPELVLRPAVNDAQIIRKLSNTSSTISPGLTPNVQANGFSAGRCSAVSSRRVHQNHVSTNVSEETQIRNALAKNGVFDRQAALVYNSRSLADISPRACCANVA